MVARIAIAPSSSRITGVHSNSRRHFGEDAFMPSILSNGPRPLQQLADRLLFTVTDQRR
jgi:hypothetical protein